MFIKSMVALSGAVALGAGVAGGAEAAALNNDFGLNNPDQLITFDEILIPNNTPIADAYSALGIEFSPTLTYTPNTAGIATLAGINGKHVGNFPGGTFTPQVNPFSIKFTAVQSAAAFVLRSSRGSTVFTAFLNSREIESFTSRTNSFPTTTDIFYGFENIEFDEIKVELFPDSNFPPLVRIDNLQTIAATADVPEPMSTIALLAVGAVTVGSVLNRKAAA